MLAVDFSFFHTPATISHLICRVVRSSIFKGVIYPCKVGCIWVVCLAEFFAALQVILLNDVLIQIRVLVDEKLVLADAVAICYFLRVDTLACDKNQLLVKKFLATTYHPFSRSM